MLAQVELICALVASAITKLNLSSPSTLQVHWSHPLLNNGMHTCVVHYKREGGSEMSVGSSSTVQATIKNLTENTTYYFTVVCSSSVSLLFPYCPVEITLSSKCSVVCQTMIVCYFVYVLDNHAEGVVYLICTTVRGCIAYCACVHTKARVLQLASCVCFSTRSCLIRHGQGEFAGATCWKET